MSVSVRSDLLSTWTWYVQIIETALRLPPDERANLDHWDSLPNTRTTDWPGWAKYGLLR